jgi:hypothetical protein
MMSVEIANSLNKFKSGLSDFFNDLYTQYPSESQLILVKQALDYNTIPIELVAQHFAINVASYRQQIKNRDDKFFLENIGLFGITDSGITGRIKELWKTMDNATQKVIWDWVDHLVKLNDDWRRVSGK